MKATIRLGGFTLSVISWSLSLAASGFLSTIDRELANGDLDRTAAATLKAYSLYLPQKLPARYQGLDRSGYVKGASLVALSVWKNLSSLAEADRSEILKAMAPPSGVTDLQLTTSHFIIHYTQTGVHAAASEFIDSVAAVLEYCYSYEVDTLKYNPPPTSPGYHVYVIDMPTYYGGKYYYGITQPEGGSSYITLDNDYNGFPTSGLDGLKVTAAHEFFHAIQYGYTVFPYEYNDLRYAWWMEICSVWMEDVVYDDINDYYNYLRNSSGVVEPWFKIPHKSMMAYDGWHEYGSCLFNHYLRKKFGATIIRRVWEANAQDQRLLPAEALDEVLGTTTYGSSLAEAFREFAVWNFFTGSRADTTAYYSEGDSFPEIFIDSAYHYHALDSTTTLNWPVFIPYRPDSFGSNYIVINRVSLFDTLDTVRFIFHDSGNSRWNVSIICQDTAGYYWSGPLAMVSGRAGYYDLQDPGRVAKVVLAVNRLSAEGQATYTYGLQLEVVAVAHTNIYQAFPNPFKPAENDVVYFPMTLAEPVETITVRILSQGGDLVRKLVFDKGFFPYAYTRKQDLEANHLYWDGRNAKGHPVASGYYFYHIQMDKNTFGGMKKISVIR